MKNPWKKNSKINPQREDGTRQINSYVLDALIRAQLPTTEMSVVLTIISKTWGFNKTTDAISTSQFVEATGFTPRAIKQARASLFDKKIIFFRPSKRVKRGSPLNEYLFNKHYDTWKTKTKKKGEQMFTGEQRRQKRVNDSTPTIETSTIERVLYKYNTPERSADIKNLCQNFIHYINKTYPKLAPKADGLFENSCKVVDQLIRIDDFDLEYIRDVLLWAVKDHFWSGNLFSLASLRKKDKDDPRTKFQKIANSFEKEKKPIRGGRSEENARACSEFISEGGFCG